MEVECFHSFSIYIYRVDGSLSRHIAMLIHFNMKSY